MSSNNKSRETRDRLVDALRRELMGPSTPDEALARHYSDIHGMSMICIRICFFQSPDSRLLRERPEMRREWCSPRDLTQLILKSIGADLPFAVFFGVSNNTGRYWDIRNAQELVGYDPQDDGAQLPELSTPESDRFNG